jgi:hypothetical protein
VVIISAATTPVIRVYQGYNLQDTLVLRDNLNKEFPGAEITLHNTFIQSKYTRRLPPLPNIEIPSPKKDWGTIICVSITGLLATVTFVAISMYYNLFNITHHFWK